MHQIQVKGSPPAVGNRFEKYHEKELPTARPHHTKNSSLSQGSRFGKGTCKQTMLPANKFKRHHAKKEMLRRALTPPVRQPTWQWCDFQQTPSRLSNMSTSWISLISSIFRVNYINYFFFCILPSFGFYSLFFFFFFFMWERQKGERDGGGGILDNVRLAMISVFYFLSKRTFLGLVSG